MREVKVVIFWEKVRKPLAGMVVWLERLSYMIFNGKREISSRSTSMSPRKLERSRVVRLGNLWKRRGRKGCAEFQIMSENQKWLVMWRNCL